MGFIEFDEDRAEWRVQPESNRVAKGAIAAAARQPTPEGRARAFARLLRQVGVYDVDEWQLRRRFGAGSSTDP